ncbi:MAG: hypothetical protein A3F16_08000 [Deltaproteobacteria bacterium RIFCSPHIGHO2_12_FULL_43_9]|nr:MAG: hypothetical protein A3F16_08000 [Deltaproteobacteria bacterium RIFCSPHIGHO2_12_FULL_43_9]
MIQTIAKGLGDLVNKVVFIGGATTPLYIEDPAASEVRPTEDVDCIIEIASQIEYHKLEENLRKRGFKNLVDSTGKAPICRWKFNGVIVDVMPTDEKILGFSNRWYIEGIKNAQPLQLSSTEILIFTSPYFIAAKIEAFHGRGKKDFRISPDMEDIITLLDGRPNFKKELLSAPASVQKYLKQEFKKFIRNEEFEEGLYAHLRTEGNTAKRVKGFMRLLKEITL